MKILPSKIEGIVVPSGSKNISLPIICSTLFINGECRIENVPKLFDVQILLDIFSLLNVDYHFYDNVLYVNSKNKKNNEIPLSLIKQIRASYYLLGCLLPSFKRMVFTYPGGCSFQDRPIDYHIEAFKKLGVIITKHNDEIIFEANNLIPNQVEFKNKSVGATLNTIFLMLQIEGRSEIINPSNDFEVIEVINYLKKSKAIIYYENNKLIIYGGKNLYSCNFKIKSDRIEIATFAFLASIRGKLLICDVVKNNNLALFNILKLLKINYSYENSCLFIKESEIDKSHYFILNNDPGIPTDIGPLLAVLLLKNEKISIIEDKIYPYRNKYVNELKKIGAKMVIKNNKIIIFPHSIFNSNVLNGMDLRGTMSLVLGGYFSYLPQEIDSIFYLTRGYENIFGKLKDINMRIEK